MDIYLFKEKIWLKYCILVFVIKNYLGYCLDYVLDFMK